MTLPDGSAGDPGPGGPRIPPPYVPGHGLLAGRSVLITAAAGAGIGAATARRVLEEGAARLMISDIHPRRLEEATSALAADFPHAEVRGMVADVTHEADVQALVAAADGDGGDDGAEANTPAAGSGKRRVQGSGVDLLINNAGLGGSRRVVDMADEEWQRVLDVTLTGTFRMTRAMLRRMQARGRGVIVNNASVLGWRAQKEQAHYAAAKAGVMALTRCSALEAAEFGVRVNAVAPSIAFHDFLRKTAPAELLEQLAAREAFGRAAEVWEIANVIVFLASDYSSYLTGEIVSASSQHP